MDAERVMPTPKGFGVVAIIIGLITAACAKDLSEIEPFPCADDGFCPSSFTCVTGYGCTRSPLEQVPFPCDSGGTCPAGLVCLDAQCARPSANTLCGTSSNRSSENVDCSLAGPGYSCQNGLCVASCSSSTFGCGSGKACVDGYCLTDCSSGTTCTAGLECSPTYLGSGSSGSSSSSSSGGTGRADAGSSSSAPPSRVCANPDYAYSACDSVSSASSCTPSTSTFSCPDKTNPCSTFNGGVITCPSHSSCTSDTTCSSCELGYVASYCDGTPCTNGCTGGDWACKRVDGSSSKPTGCNDDLTGWSGTCKCQLGVTQSFGCTTSSTVTTDTSSCEKICAKALGGGR